MPNKRRFPRKSFNFRAKGKFNQRPFKAKREYQHQNQLFESDVGITQFISKLEGFSGVIKARFSDFQVNEIGLDGEVTKLTDLSIPPEFLGKKNLENVEVSAESPIKEISQDIWEAIIKLETPEQSVHLDATNLSKDDRTKIHICLQDHLNHKVYANTTVIDDKKWMIFKKNSGNRDDRRLRWPRDKGEYIHFLVYKECLDTLETSLKIAGCVRLGAANLNYAGVKDKRAKTTQWFSLRKVDPARLINRTKVLKNVKIGNITFKDTPLKLGHLLGNKFRVALRNVTGSDDLIKDALEELQTKGFINYYGLQRFGNDKEVPTFAIGVQLLLGNWKQACQMILKPKQSDDSDLEVTKAKKVYQETGNAKKALKELEGNRTSCVEHLLLQGLSKEHENDFVNALASIPRNTRLLYIHSFQSLVWNLVASKRIENFGLNVVEGDLILLDQTHPIDSEEDEDTDKKPKVKSLTADECANYTIYDIVLPLPGYDVLYPQHLQQFYKETLETFGLTLEMTKQKVQTYSLGGAYRKLVERVKDLSWKIMRYTDPNYNLIRSDLEELQGELEPESVTDGAYKALILEFILPPSAYATMVLREILKTDTSSSSNAKLNDYHIIEEKVQQKIVEEGNEEFTDKVGLLSDPAKYAAFKSMVFHEDDSSLKRKHSDEDAGSVKVVKVNENV